jgi:triosephosphate isomerase
MSKRRKIVAGNWKMNLWVEDTYQLVSKIVECKDSFDCDVIVFPSFVHLQNVEEMYRGSIELGAQNCCHFQNGAYTGEVSAMQLATIGVEYVIVGHSERREHFGETNELLRQKIHQALQSNLKVVFCCGESLAIRNQNKQLEFVKKQLEESLFGLPEERISKVTIAYEPVWAIGTGLNATAEQAQEMHLFIRTQIAAQYSNEIAEQVRIIYGGSCKPANAAELFACPDVDGGLVGGASLVADDFLAIIKAAEGIS